MYHCMLFGWFATSPHQARVSFNNNNKNTSTDIVHALTKYPLNVEANMALQKNDTGFFSVNPIKALSIL